MAGLSFGLEGPVQELLFGSEAVRGSSRLRGPSVSHKLFGVCIGVGVVQVAGRSVGGS